MHAYCARWGEPVSRSQVDSIYAKERGGKEHNGRNESGKAVQIRHAPTLLPSSLEGELSSKEESTTLGCFSFTHRFCLSTKTDLDVVSWLTFSTPWRSV